MGKRFCFQITARQCDFLRSEATETLFGGAAGGGKSYAQLIDALVFAGRYSGSRQLILRRTIRELERSLIAVSEQVYPQAVGKLVRSDNCWRMANGSVIEFGHCQYEGDVTRYQSAEYDVIRFDELTHFTEYQYTYLISRVRGANGFPKQVKSTTNPGGIGHDWVKKRFIDALEPDVVKEFEGGSRVFLPAKVTDNVFLMRRDPGYRRRLKNLGERERKALLEGDWDLQEGRYFPEFSREIHVCEPFPVPKEWKRWLSVDYGLDMFAALWVAQAPDGRHYVYREVYEPGLILSEAAERVTRAEQGEGVYCRLAPPDLFHRRQETGRSAADIWQEHGLYFEQSGNRRVDGWYAVKELMKPIPDGMGGVTAKLQVFSGCRNLIRTLGAVRHDDRNPNDVAGTPHELTHAPDALRGYAVAVCEAAEADDDRYGGEVQEFLHY